MTTTMDTDIRVPALDTLTDEAPPSVDEIMALKTAGIEYFKGFHMECAKSDTYYFGKNEIPAPDGFHPIHTAQAMSIINVATDHVDADHAVIDVPLSSPRSKARAERLKKFYQGTWANIKNPVKQTAAKHAFAYGIGWFKTMWQTDQWPDAPRMSDFNDVEEYKDAIDDFMERRNIMFPIVVENINPQRMVWDTSRIGPRWAIEFYETKASDIKQMFPQWTGLGFGSNQVQWTEYWDEKWFVYMAGNEIVDSGEHGYGFFPYESVLPARSMDWNDRPPHERYIGLLSGIYDLLDEHARLMSAISAIIRNTAWRTLDFTGPEHLVEKARSDYEIFGGMNSLPTGVTVNASPLVQVPPDLLQQLAVVETQIEQATFPNVIRGVRPRGVSTGFGISVLAGMGRLIFQGVASGMAHAIEKCNSGFARLVENKAGGRLTVHARTEIHSFDQTISAQDIKGYYENIVTLKAEAPEERERESLLALRLYQGGVISLYETQARSGVINPLEMQVDQAAEALMQSPGVQMAMQQLAAERINLLGQASQLLGGGQDGGTGNQFLPGQGQLQEPGQGGIQAQRSATNAQAGAFPRGTGGLDLLGASLSTAPGTPQNMPSGQTV